MPLSEYSFEGKRFTTKQALRLFTRFSRPSDDDCWIWQGKKSSGYAWFSIGNGINVLGHRVVYEALIGPIPEGLSLLHSCDTPPCVNPRHLFPGTQAENMADAARKNRMQIGEQRPTAKLSNENALLLKALLNRKIFKHRILAEQFGVGITTVYDIEVGRCYSKVLNANGY